MLANQNLCVYNKLCPIVGELTSSPMEGNKTGFSFIIQASTHLNVSELLLTQMGVLLEGLWASG